MQRKILMTAALVVAVVTAGVPIIAADVTPDCDHDYDISSATPTPHNLGTSGNLVGRVVVDDSADITVQVTLITDNDILDFGVFYDATECLDAAAAGLSTCDTSETIETELFPDDMECVLDKAQSGQEIAYFFVYENGGTSSLQYTDQIV